MHEMSIAQSLLDIIREEMAKNRAHSLKSVRLRIGEMSAVVPESLSFCFQVITEGTEMEGAELVMEHVPLTGKCRSCSKTFEVQNYAFECPYCRSPQIEILSGRDLNIVEMEVD